VITRRICQRSMHAMREAISGHQRRICLRSMLERPSLGAISRIPRHSRICHISTKSTSMAIDGVHHARTCQCCM
jgi:hypothetical protein